MSGKGKSSVRRIWAQALRAATDNSGAAAVEFALVEPIFIALILVSLYSGIVFTAKSELDFTAQKVARMIMTGQVTSQSALQTAICNNTAGLLDCNSVMANLTQYTSANLDNINTSTPALTFNGDGRCRTAGKPNSGPRARFRSFNLCTSILRSCRGKCSILLTNRTARI